MAMQYRNIAKANNPFWFIGKMGKINFIYNPYQAISSPCTHNGIYTVVVKQLLKIIAALLIGTGKCKIFFTDGIAQLYFKTPLIYFFYCRLNGINTDKTCRRRYSNCIPGLKAGWCFKAAAGIV